MAVDGRQPWHLDRFTLGPRGIQGNEGQEDQTAISAITAFLAITAGPSLKCLPHPFHLSLGIVQ